MDVPGCCRESCCAQPQPQPQPQTKQQQEEDDWDEDDWDYWADVDRSRDTWFYYVVEYVFKKNWYTTVGGIFIFLLFIALMCFCCIATGSAGGGSIN